MTPSALSPLSSPTKRHDHSQAYIIRTRYTYTDTTLWFKEGTCRIFMPSQFVLPINHPRFLTENDDVWSQNAWDHVPPPADQDATIAASLARQRATPVPDDDKPKYNTRPAKHWSVPISSIPTTLHQFLIYDPGTTFTKRTPRIFSRIASGAFLLALAFSTSYEIVRSVFRLHLEFPELVAAAELSVRPHPLVETETQLYPHSKHRPDLVRSLKLDVVRRPLHCIRRHLGLRSS